MRVIVIFATKYARYCNFWHFRDIICVNSTYQKERGNTCMLIVIASTFLCRFLVMESKYSEEACKAFSKPSQRYYSTQWQLWNARILNYSYQAKSAHEIWTCPQILEPDWVIAIIQVILVTSASNNYPLCILSSLHCVTSALVVLIVSAHLGARERFSMPSKTCPPNLNLPTSDTGGW